MISRMFKHVFMFRLFGLFLVGLVLAGCTNMTEPKIILADDSKVILESIQGVNGSVNWYDYYAAANKHCNKIGKSAQLTNKINTSEGLGITDGFATKTA